MKAAVNCMCGATPVLQTRQRNFGMWPDIWQARLVCTGNKSTPHELCGPWIEAGVGVENDSPALLNMATHAWNNALEFLRGVPARPPCPDAENTLFLEMPPAVREVVLRRTQGEPGWAASAAVGAAHAEECERSTPQAALRAACRVAMRGQRA